MTRVIRDALAAAIAVGGLIAAFVPVAAAQDKPEMRPFVMRWDDTEKTVLDLSFLSPGEAGANGPVVVSDDGYLTTGGERLKLFGNNTSAGTVFADDVTDDQRNAFAGRMRKFGFNAIRFHHLGAQWVDRNIFGPVTNLRNETTTQVDPESLNRLHRWIAAFKRHGIYTNMNLLVSRRFVSEDGLPAVVDEMEWKLQGTAAMWHPKMIELQKEYARQILASDNPHTGMPLAQDPSLATVEMNNENGILHSWLGGDLDQVPEEMAEPLRVMWNEWLAEKYDTDDAMAQAWNAVDVALGEPMIDGFTGFNLNAQGGAAAVVEGDDNTTRVRVERPGAQGWHVQFTRPVPLEAGKPYTLRFRARADSPRTISVAARQNHDPWQMLGFERRAQLGDAFQDYSFTFVPSASDENARIEFGDLSQEGASYEFENISLRPGGDLGPGENERLADGTLSLPKRDSDSPMTLPQRKDWFAFAMDAERAYFGEMRRFLKEDLGIVAPVVGTIVGTSPMGVQRHMDAIDTHAYWRHPEFPGTSWDPENWIVRPDSMVDHPETAAILGPMLRQVRVDGRRLPHMLTEYDHPAPNPHAGEGPLFLAAYAALQDFDAIYLFAYDKEDFSDEGGKIEGFFDTVNHPTVVANCIPAALMFRRGDIQPAKQEATIGITEEMELDALVERGAAWSMVDYDDFEGDALNAYKTAVAVNYGTGSDNFEDAVTGGPNLYTDTRQTIWTGEQGLFYIMSPAALGGLGNGPSIKVTPALDGGGKGLASVDMSRPTNESTDWSSGILSSLNSPADLHAEGPKRALLVATGNYANTDWQWKTDEKLSLGTNWGTAPTLIEVVPVTLTLKANKSAKAWALDAAGRRVEEVDVELKDGTAVIRVGPGHTETATLFYEIEWE